MIEVSVVIPTYNRCGYVQQAIDSILAQTYPAHEIIVIDDGSTDGTGEMLTARYADRVRYVRQDNQGESAARNHGLTLSTGKYVALLDSDDVWLPEKLAKQIPVLDTEPRLGAVFCEAWIIDGQGQRLADLPLGAGQTGADLTLDRLCLDNDVVGPSTALVRREVFDRIGGFDPHIQYGEDWDMWLRIAAQYPLAVINEPLACLRRHHGTQSYYPSAEKNARRLNDHLAVLNKAFANWPGLAPDGLREIALARRYMQAFLSEMAVGNVGPSVQDLQMIQQLTPDMLRDTEQFGQLIVDTAAIMAEDARRASLEQAADYVQQVVRQLRATGASDKRFENHVTARAYATLGFIAYQHQHISDTRYYFLRAIRHDTQWLRNGGVLSILAESILGKPFIHSVRKMARIRRRDQHQTGAAL